MTKFASSMTSGGRNILKYTATSLIAAAFIWLVARKVDWSGFWSGLQQTRWAYIALFIAASVMALVFRTLRWRDMLRPIDGSVKLLDIWDSINVGALANVALPGVGEFLRCGYASRRKENYSKFLGTIVMERIWDILAIGVLILLALALKWGEFGPFLKKMMTASDGTASSSKIIIVAAAGVILVAAAVLCYLLRGRSRTCAKICSAIGGIFHGAAATLRMKNKGLFAIYTVMIWFSYVLMSYFGLKAIGDLSGLGMTDALFISAVGNLASVIPVPSGMGPYHYLVMTTLSGLYGCSSEIGLLYAVLCHESHAILIIVLGAISYVRLTLRNKHQ